MEKEISSGTMLGIVLIALAAVIGLGFGIFSIAKGVANQGTVDVQTNLESVQASAYNDYDDKLVTGLMVKSAIQTFGGKSTAILVHTTAMEKGVKTYVGHNNIFARVIGTASDAKVYINYCTILQAKGEEDGYYTRSGGTKITVNDCPTLKSAEGRNAAEIYEGVLNVEAPFVLDANGKVVQDNNVGGLNRTGNSEYINDNGKFQANLIKDASGAIVGVIFTQMAK